MKKGLTAVIQRGKKKTCEDGCLLVENGKERFKLVNESFG